MTKSCLTIEQWTQVLNQDKPHGKHLIEVPHSKQQNLISYILQPDEQVKLVDLCCGRGFGKSFFAIYLATMALSRGPNECGLFLEPDWKRVRRVFLGTWQQIVPRRLYVLNKSEQCITWLPTGARLYYGPRNITGAMGATDDAQLGQNLTFIIDDEAALRCSHMMYLNNLATIREQSSARFYLTLSTPRVGEYSRLITSDGHKLFRGTSADNPYLPDDYVENLVSKMSPQMARREIYGEMVSLEGRIWEHWEETDWDLRLKRYKTSNWPLGNVHPHKHDHDKPYFLFLDLGSRTSAWSIVQAVDPIFGGKRMWQHDPVWVATAEYTPNREGSAEAMFRRINADYGRPAVIVAGHDMTTGDSASGKTAQYFATTQWGGVQTKIVKGWIADKEIQHSRMSGMIHNTKNERRFCISQYFKSHDDTKRGLRELMLEDTWCDTNYRGKSTKNGMPKEGRLEHIRDALLYGTVGMMSKPTFAERKAYAA
jgi:hypothetical protein